MLVFVPCTAINAVVIVICCFFRYHSLHPGLMHNLYSALCIKLFTFNQTSGEVMFLVITNSKRVLYWFCSGCIHLNTPCLWSFCPPPLPCKRSSLCSQFHRVVLCLLVVFMSVSIPLGALCYGRLEGGGGKRLLVVPCPKPKGHLMQYIYYMHWAINA